MQFVTLHPTAAIGPGGVIAATPEQHLQQQRALRQYQYQVALTNPALSAHHNGSVRSGYRYAMPNTTTNTISTAAIPIVAGGSGKFNGNSITLALPTSQIPSNNTSHHNTRRASLIDNNETQSHHHLNQQQQHHHQQQKHNKSDKKLASSSYTTCTK
eukprot:UN03643